MRKIDCHVHLVGDGSSGSDCWFRLDSAYQKLQSRLMLKGMNIDPKYLKGGLDEVYIETVATMVRESSLDAIVFLAQDIPYDRNGNPIPEKAAYYVPNDFLFKAVDRHPELFIPAVSIHPGREDAMKELQRCINRGARILKLLPNCLDVDYSEERYSSFWQCLAEHNVILLSHSGGEKTLPVINHKLADPALLRTPLEYGVTCIAAHAAGRSGIFDPDYTLNLVEMFKDYPHLYADNSALSSLNRARTGKKILNESSLPRILHGSDLPVPIMGSGPWMSGLISWSDYRQCKRIENPLERDYQLKRAMGFPEESFLLLGKLLDQDKESNSG